MSSKIALAQALFYALLTLSMHIKAMDVSQQKTTTFSVSQAMEIQSIIYSKKVAVCIQTEIPSSVQKANHARYYNAHKSEIEHKFAQALIAYSCKLKERQDNWQVAILPDQIDFNVDTKSFTLKKCLGSHYLTNTMKAQLKEQVASTFNPAQQQFKNKRATVHVTFQMPFREPIILDLAMLHELYNNKQTLNLRPETQRPVLERQIAMASARNILRPMLRQNASALPDPDAYLERLHTEDVKAMVAYYLTNFDCLDID